MDPMEKLFLSLDRAVDSIVKEFKCVRDKVASIAKSVIEQNSVLLLEHVYNPKVKLDVSIIGLDGTYTLLFSVDGFHVYSVVVSAVEISGNGITVEYPIVLADYIYDPTRDDLDRILEDIMLSSETYALTTISRRALVLLDGPLIDPPREVEQLSLSIIKKIFGLDVEHYHRWRAQVVHTHIARGSTVVGIVKRIRSRGEVLRCLGLSDGLGDEELLDMLFSYIYTHLCRETQRVAVALKPCRVCTSGIAEIYRAHGIDIISIYLSVRKSKPIRVDIAVDKDLPEDSKMDRVIDVVKHIVALIPPGNRLPLPVALAHEKCAMSKRLASRFRDVMLKKIVKEIVDIYGLIEHQ